MATTAAKKKVNTSQTIGLKGNTIADVVEAQQLVGAPDSAGLTVNPGSLYYLDENGNQANDGDTYNVTFSWTEEK